MINFFDNCEELWQYWQYCISRIESDILSVMFASYLLHWLPPIWFSDIKFFLLYGLFLVGTERNELSYNRIFLIYGVRFLIYGLFWRVWRRRKALFLPLWDREEEWNTSSFLRESLTNSPLLLFRNSVILFAIGMGTEEDSSYLVYWGIIFWIYRARKNGF